MASTNEQSCAYSRQNKNRTLQKKEERHQPAIIFMIQYHHGGRMLPNKIENILTLL